MKNNPETICREIVKNKSYMILDHEWNVVKEEDGMLFDLQSANVFLTVFDSLKDEKNRQKLLSLSPFKAVEICWKLVS